MPKQKQNGQNWIRLVEYCSSEVSDPSEVCVTGLQRFGIQDPSPPKALFTRVLKVPTTSTSPSTSASQPACFRRQSCPQTSNVSSLSPNVYCLAPILSGTGLTSPPTKVLPPKPRPIPPPLRTNCVPPILSV